MKFESLDIVRQRRFSVMWTEERDEWVLLHTPGEEGLGIFNRAKRLARLIEDEALHDAVVEKMIQEGIPIVDEPTLFRELYGVKQDGDSGPSTR